ncbi:hypothetical protein E2562_032933 [Oryza meyeriana var. granulata]|uniref:Uncharacterized protein n=1 Tax=Oryza meyeriana var. granulata TaxID=110450 RepID=A0A6G1DTG6_9ORYZ|nr:hypothetical protein E2562_032933 [Oryza meyeriana var. granulata]
MACNVVVYRVEEEWEELVKARLLLRVDSRVSARAMVATGEGLLVAVANRWAPEGTTVTKVFTMAAKE